MIIKNFQSESKCCLKWPFDEEILLLVDECGGGLPVDENESSLC